MLLLRAGAAEGVLDGDVLTVSAITATVLISTVLQYRKYRTIRAFSFVRAGSVRLSPAIHGVISLAGTE